MKKTITLMLITVTILTASNNYSRTPEQIHSMAVNYINFSQMDKNKFEFNRDWKLITDTAELRGYIAATIDSNKNLRECLSHKSINEITASSARLLSITPSNTSYSAYMSATAAISIICK